MKWYRKRLVVIEAVQWCGDNFDEVGRFCPVIFGPYLDGHLEVEALGGRVNVESGDFVIRGVQGEFYPCKPDIFAMTYEEVDASPSSEGTP